MSWIRDLLISPECLGCQRIGSHVCASCLIDLRPFIAQTSAGVSVCCVSTYDSWLRERLIEFKSGNSLMVRELAELLSPQISNNALLVPIPSTHIKIKARGFDTVGLLCAQLCKIEPHRRVHHTLTFARVVRDQVGLGAGARQVNMNSAFQSRIPVHGDFVVIDDVLTTGATIDAAARALRIAGANSVTAAVLCGSPQKRYG